MKYVIITGLVLVGIIVIGFAVGFSSAVLGIVALSNLGLLVCSISLALLALLAVGTGIYYVVTEKI